MLIQYVLKYKYLYISRGNDIEFERIEGFFLLRELSLLLGMSRHTPQTLSIFTQYKTTKILEQSQVLSVVHLPVFRNYVTSK